MDNFFPVGRVIDVESQSQAKPYPLEVAIGYVASLVSRPVSVVWSNNKNISVDAGDSWCSLCRFVSGEMRLSDTFNNYMDTKKY